MATKQKEVEITAQQLIETYRADQAKMDFLQKRQQSLLQIVTEMNTALDSIKEIRKAKEEEIIMVSLGAGIFAEAKIANVKKVKSSLAGNILIDSQPEKVLEELQEAMDKAKKELETVQLEMQKTSQNMQGVATILQESQKAVQQSKNSSDVSSVS